MSKRFYAAFVPLLAVVAFAAMPATSQAAESHWYTCKHEATATHKFSDSECQKEVANTGSWEWKRLPFTSAKTQVITFGKLTLTWSNGIVLTCKVIEAGNIWNGTEATAGQDNIEAFVFYECKVVGAATCKVKEPIEFTFNDELTVFKGEPGEIFEPVEGKLFVAITITGCSVEGKYEVTGKQQCELPEATVAKAEHEVVCTPAGSELKLKTRETKVPEAGEMQCIRR